MRRDQGRDSGLSSCITVPTDPLGDGDIALSYSDWPSSSRFPFLNTESLFRRISSSKPRYPANPFEVRTTDDLMLR